MLNDCVTDIANILTIFKLKREIMECRALEEDDSDTCCMEDIPHSPVWSLFRMPRRWARPSKTPYCCRKTEGLFLRISDPEQGRKARQRWWSHPTNRPDPDKDPPSHHAQCVDPQVPIKIQERRRPGIRWIFCDKKLECCQQRFHDGYRSRDSG